MASPRTHPVVVFLDISIGARGIGRIQIELLTSAAPRTCENFRQLCTGEFKRNGIPIGYKGAPMHRVVPRSLVQGGDFMRRDGTGTTSIYGDFFPDEPSPLPHDAGMVAMANSGPNTNGCQFYITTGACRELDGKNVVFGRVIDGMNVVRLIEEVPLSGTTPKLPVTITQCGEM